jgi:DNA-directed RNA polymerase subunit RPC12/RpoP
MLALLLCKWATKLAWLDLSLVTQSEEKPYLYYCPYCHREVNGREPEWAEYKTIGCTHCHRQFLVVGSDGGPELVAEETFDICEYECHWQEPYGFVPEAGCPIRDRA